MTDEIELLPCPFCGSVGEHMFAPCSTPISYVRCVDCGANGQDFAEEFDGDTEYAAKAIAAWNTRAAIASIRKDDELRDALEEARELLSQAGFSVAFIDRALSSVAGGGGQ